MYCIVFVFRYIFASDNTICFFKMENNNHKLTATGIHLGILTQYIIPFGNFIVPIILWSIGSKKSEFINHNGKQVINFQLSVFVYSAIMCIITIPIIIFSIMKNVLISQYTENGDFYVQKIDFANLSVIGSIGILLILFLIIMKIAEIFLAIYGAVKASNGILWKYPFTINFIK